MIHMNYACTHIRAYVCIYVYVASIVIYLCYVYYATERRDENNENGDSDDSTTISSFTKWNLWDQRRKKLISKVIIPISASSMVILHALEVFVLPPTKLPDLFPVLWVIGSCISFCFMWIMILWKLFVLHSVSVESTALFPKVKSGKKKSD